MEYVLEHRQQPYRLRAMQSSDLDSVLTIENSTQQHPWSRASMSASLASSHQCWILETMDDKAAIMAYAITSTAADEAELLNITVAMAYQRQGIGRLLLTWLSQSFQSSVHTLFLEVRESNHAAIALYHSLHFNEVGIRPNYYPAQQGRENALIMALPLCL